MSTPSERVVRAYLAKAREDLDAAVLLSERGNATSAFHLQQAAEKLMKAVRLHRGLLVTAEHDLESQIEGSHKGLVKLPPGDAWRERLLPLVPLSVFATAYRYPSPTGNVKPGPPRGEIDRWASMLADLLTRADEELVS